MPKQFNYEKTFNKIQDLLADEFNKELNLDESMALLGMLEFHKSNLVQHISDCLPREEIKWKNHNQSKI